MSITNGKQKRNSNNKKGPCFSTILVHPIRQTLQKTPMIDLSNSYQNDTASRYIRGQCIRGESIAYVFSKLKKKFLANKQL